MSPKFATPQTIEKKTTGTTSIFREDMKIFPKTSAKLIKLSMKLGCHKLIMLPKTSPSNKDINILLVSDIIII